MPIAFQATGVFQAIKTTETTNPMRDMTSIVSGKELQELASRVGEYPSSSLSDFQDQLFFPIQGTILAGFYSLPILDQVSCQP